jgi:Archaeal/vacuolar-type H+-ATPase subunit A
MQKKESESMSNEGTIYRISGPVVTAIGMTASMYKRGARRK